MERESETQEHHTRGRTRSQDRRTGENGGDQAPGPENGGERGGTIGGAERDTQTYRDAPTELNLAPRIMGRRLANRGA